MPDFGTVHTDVFLTNLSIMYLNPVFVADSVFPMLPVEKRSDKYVVYSRDAALGGSGLDKNGKALSLRTPKQEAQTSDYTLSSESFYCEEFAKRQLVTDAERKYSDNPLIPETDATISLTQKLMLDNELMVAYKVGTPANYNAGMQSTLTTGNTGTSWASYSSPNSLPMKNLQTANAAVLQQIQRSANAFFINHQAAKIFTEHPTYRDEFKYVSKEGQTQSGLAPVIKGLKVTEGPTQQLAGDVWQDSVNSLPFALVHYSDPDVGPRTVHFGRTFDAPDDTSGSHGYNVRRYRWDALKGDYIEVSMMRDHEFVSVDNAGLAIGGYVYLSVIV